MVEFRGQYTYLKERMEIHLAVGVCKSCPGKELPPCALHGFRLVSHVQPIRIETTH